MLRSLLGATRYSGRLRPGKRSPPREVPAHIARPDYAEDGRPRHATMRAPDVKAGEYLEAMRAASRVSREVLDAVVAAVRPGVTTDELDAIVHAEAIARGAYPSPLNYCGFPKAAAISINEVVCHGIPDDTELLDGDIVNIDVSCYIGGVHGDLSEMVLVGDVDDASRGLVRVTHDAWQAAIDACGPGVPYGRIGEVIEAYAVPRGYSVVRQFCGHGIGRVFHAPPNVVHYASGTDYGVMLPGHTFTIEPMLNAGSADILEWADGWTITTADGARSAQFEHTLLVTEHGVEALTARTENSQTFHWEDGSGGASAAPGA